MLDGSFEAGAVIYAKATTGIADPPVRREDAAIKLMFPVPSIGDARALAARLGGELNPPDREWQFGAYRVCDGHDSEGNVFQVRASESSHSDPHVLTDEMP